MSLLYAIKHFFSRDTPQPDPAPQPEPEPEPRTKERARVIASWYEDGHFRVAIDRGASDGVQRGDIYHCTHPRLKHLVCADDGRVLKAFYVGDFYIAVIALSAEWAECRKVGDELRPASWRNDMDATFLHGGV
ncbi:MAG: hypothetical protein ACXWQ5_00675 [Ktedonobacterales bacterium]